ncbi:DNA-processing protein DprA [Candidatus Tisiphia endosymbiont of Nemotelus uliginosus]|uniref:DNA-processing protein DprA n=1 Tax=Candidatus Tisiphia endosymbiont of Nemotelus uliginosus TaxID=3077926 RepID=UPI0035C8B4F2
MLKELFLNKKLENPYTQETIDILRLIRSENVGPRTFWGLIKVFGNASIAIENIQEFSVRGGRPKLVKVFSQNDALKELELLDQNNAQLITYKSSFYSQLLAEIFDPPPILSYKGNIELLSHNRCVAIVGARNASVNGRSLTAKLTTSLIELGYITVSGLARGIDTVVHQVNTSKTIGVIAGGIDHIYPLENAKLFEQIVRNGLIIAELPIGSKPLAQHFPQRNRIIAGLSLGTLVIEASLKSGSLITSKFALQHNREVFAVPGFPIDPRCQGTNKLIKQGAHIVESVDDIVTNLPSFDNILNKAKDIAQDSQINNQFKTLNMKYHDLVTNDMRVKVRELLSATPTDFDCLHTETQLPLQTIYMIILELELAEKVIRYPGNKIVLIYN